MLKSVGTPQPKLVVMSFKKLIRQLPSLVLSLLLLLFTSCEHSMVIVNDVEEREANEIVVFLASKGIQASKTASPTTGGAGAQPGAALLFSITVEEGKMTDAMAVLNQNGLPRKKGVGLLDIFAKQGLITTDKEETIRYQAGLAEQIASTIRKIDGVIDADVQLSIPAQTTAIPGAAGQAPPPRTTAAVYVKHQGILDDPNSHLVTKIKRLVSSSVSGLDLNDVTVISDRSRFTDITLAQVSEEITPKGKEYVSIWSIVMNRASLGRFRFLFFTLMFATVAFGVIMGWLIWKFYPILRKRGGFRNLLKPEPFQNNHQENEPKL